MRSRIPVTDPPKIIIFGFEAESCEKFRSCAQKLKTELKILPHNCAGEKVGYLAGLPGFEASGSDMCRSEQCVIFSGIDGKMLNKLLDEMRASGLGMIPLKAAITPYNKKMTLSELIDELKAEHEKFHGSSDR